MEQKILGIIPARYGSTRLPGKPLLDINGKSMIRRVYERADATGILARLVVATDDKRISDHVKSFGGNVMMTAKTHQTGTVRCGEVAAKDKGYQVVINIQGDEPFLHREHLELLSESMNDPKVKISTLCKRMELDTPPDDKSIIKLTRRESGNALYFSRHPIPFHRGNGTWKGFKHIGIYCFRREVLLSLSKLTPVEIETAESLEQLRWMSAGYEIQTVITNRETRQVDTPEHLEGARRFAKENNL